MATQINRLSLGLTALLSIAVTSGLKAEPLTLQANTVTTYGETVPTPSGVIHDAAVWVDRKDPADSLILGAATSGGIGIYDLEGNIGDQDAGDPVNFIDLRYDFPFGSSRIDLVVAYDSGKAKLSAYAIDGDKPHLTQISKGAFFTKANIAGLCMYRSPISGRYYAFAVATNGLIQQWEFFYSAGAVDARLIRSIPVGVGSSHCAVHDASSTLYYADRDVGLWKIPAEPEAERSREAVDLASPFGRISGKATGVAIYDTAGDEKYLIAAIADQPLLQVYNLRSSEHVGGLAIPADNTPFPVARAEGLEVSGISLPGADSNGFLLIADANVRGGRSNLKLIRWSDISDALGLNAAPARDVTRSTEPATTFVLPSAETDPVDSYGDAADDTVIWVHPDNPEASLIIGTDKKLGLNVYDLSGHRIQQLRDGRINNVDLRYGFLIDGSPVDIVTASNRSTDSIGIYKVDAKSGKLSDISAGLASAETDDPYGLCMYRSHRSGDFFVFATDSRGDVRQWRLEATAAGKLTTVLVREFAVGSKAEGCVTDDEQGFLYIGEEKFGIWKYQAEPDAGNDRVLVDTVESGHLQADIEGMAIYFGPGDRGYLVASSQGSNSYSVYRRDGDNAFAGRFLVGANTAIGIDGTSDTDGVEISSAYLGRDYPGGLLIVQDGRNIMPDENQNFKLISWSQIVDRLGLDSFEPRDPRAE